MVDTLNKNTVLLALTFAALLPLMGQAEDTDPAAKYYPAFAEPHIQPDVEYKVTLVELKDDAPKLIETGVFKGLESTQSEELQSRFGTVIGRYQGSAINSSTLTYSLTKFTKRGEVGYDLNITPLIEQTSKAKELVRVRTTIKYQQSFPGKASSKDSESLAMVKTNPLMSVGDISVQSWDNNGTRFVLIVKLFDVRGATFP